MARSGVAEVSNPASSFLGSDGPDRRNGHDRGLRRHPNPSLWELQSLVRQAPVMPSRRRHALHRHHRLHQILACWKRPGPAALPFHCYSPWPAASMWRSRAADLGCGGGGAPAFAIWTLAGRHRSGGELGLGGQVAAGRPAGSCVLQEAARWGLSPCRVPRGSGLGEKCG